MSPNANATSPGGPGGPLFIPISLVSDTTTFVTGPTPINFTLTVPVQQPPQEPPLVISYYEVQNQPGPSNASGSQVGAGMESGDKPKPMPIYQELKMAVLKIPNAPTPVWNNGVATFTLPLDATVFNLLSSKQSLIMVVAQINDPDISNSAGICSIPINLPIS